MILKKLKFIDSFIWYWYGHFCMIFSRKIALKSMPETRIGTWVGMIRMKMAMALLSETKKAFAQSDWISKERSQYSDQ